MAAYNGSTSGAAGGAAAGSAKTCAACSRNGSFQRVIWLTESW
jgi:hypothetical protein